MIDFHCHIDLYPDPIRIIDGCRKNKVKVLSVTTTPSAWDGTNGLITTDDTIKTALGLHPQLARERKGELKLFDQLLPNTAYVGEIGLDGSLEFRPYWQDQLTVFTHILQSCQRMGGRIMSIHSRRACRDVLNYLSSFPGAGVPVLHWFSGSLSELDIAIRLGCWFSVGPAMLCHQKGRLLIENMPYDRVITETDGPFVQYQENSILPWDVSSISTNIAKLWNMSTPNVDEIFHQNYMHLSM